MWFGATVAEATPPPESTLVLDPNPVTPGGTFTATVPCTGADTKKVIEFVIEDGNSALAPCRPDGQAVATLTAPSTLGPHGVVATLDGAILDHTFLVVQDVTPGAEEPLPETGPAGTIAVTAIGGGLVGGGIVLVAAARTRRRTGAVRP